MWIFLEDYEKMFILESLRRYLMDSPVLLAFMAVYMALVIGLAVKGTKRERAFFVWPGVVWLLTVFNPLVALPMIKLFNIDIRYYRYFWLLPLPILLGYYLIKLLEHCNKPCKILVGIVVLISCVAGREYIMTHSGIPQNIYKVDQNVVDMAELIHSDSEKEENIVLYDITFFYDMRTYDPTVIPYITRPELEAMMDSLPTDEMLGGAVENRDSHALIMYEYFGGYDLPQELMQEVMVAENIDYIVLAKDKTAQYEHFAGYDCVEIAQTEDYWLLRCP